MSNPEIINFDDIKKRHQGNPESKEDITSNLEEDLDKLRSIHGSAERIKVFAKIMDDYGVDALLGLCEGLGDAASNIISSIYLLAETKHSGGSTTDYFKIIVYQALDFAIGAVPIAGDVADYFLKANKMTANDVAKRGMELEKKIVAKMKSDGMPENEIMLAMAEIKKDAKSLPQLISGVLDLVNKKYSHYKAAA